MALTPSELNLVVVHNDPARALIGEDALSRRSTVTVLDARFGEGQSAELVELPLCITPRAFEFASDGSLVAACVGDDALVELDLSSGELSTAFDVDPSAPQKPYAMSRSPDGQRLAVAYQLSRQIVLFDVEALDGANRSLPVSGVPSSTTWLSDEVLLVSICDPDGVVLIDTQDLSIIQKYNFGAECDAPSELALGPSGGLYLVCEGDGFQRGTLVQLDAQTLAAEKSLELGVAPDRMAVITR